MKSRTKNADPTATSTTSTSSSADSAAPDSTPQPGTTTVAQSTGGASTGSTSTEANPATGNATTSPPAAATSSAPSTTTKTESKSTKEPRASKDSKSSRRPTAKQAGAAVSRFRNLIAQVVWLICLAGALVLAIAALLIAVKASGDNQLVDFFKDFADNIDLGLVDLSNPIKNFGGDNGDIKEALLNYGVGAVGYLVVGRIAERIIKP